MQIIHPLFVSFTSEVIPNDFQVAGGLYFLEGPLVYAVGKRMKKVRGIGITIGLRTMDDRATITC